MVLLQLHFVHASLLKITVSDLLDGVGLKVSIPNKVPGVII